MYLYLGTMYLLTKKHQINSTKKVYIMTNVTAKNAKKVYSNTVKSMSASAAARMKKAGLIYGPVKDVTAEYVENAKRVAMANFTLLASEDFLSAKKLLGTKAANKIQRDLQTNKRSLIPSTISK